MNRSGRGHVSSFHFSVRNGWGVVGGSLWTFVISERPYMLVVGWALTIDYAQLQLIATTASKAQRQGKLANHLWRRE